MDKIQLLAAFAERLGAENVSADEPMRGHTTFRIGGPADFFLRPTGKEALRDAVLLCEEEEIPYYIIGNGSNLLVADDGVRGAVITTAHGFDRIRREGTQITAQCGALLSTIAAEALAGSLSGFEFAGGIPGTLGGACVMNAGAYGGEMKQVLRRVEVLDERREFVCLPAEALELGYRSSIFMRRPLIALEALIELHEGDPAQIEAVSADYRARRSEKQPLNMPSAGSTFKRPEGYFAGKLIMDAGLKGYRVGGAMVSEKHCGFVVNAGGATAADVMQLVADVRARVLEAFGVPLEMEIRTLGMTT